MKERILKIIPMADINANLNSDEKMNYFNIVNIYKKHKFRVKSSFYTRNLSK